MNTATETDYSRFENMDPANVWETFERDTIENAYVEWAREEGGAVPHVNFIGDFIEHYVCWWRTASAQSGDALTDFDVECLTDALRRYCRDELGGAADRAKLVRDAIRVEIDGKVEDLNEAIAMEVEHKIGGYNGVLFRHNMKAAIDTIAGLIEEMNDF
jgi:hypothetical protein